MGDVAEVFREAFPDKEILEKAIRQLRGSGKYDELKRRINGLARLSELDYIERYGHAEVHYMDTFLQKLQKE